ncbi:helix-turn-helix transcriptional regulator [Streptomyces sp. Je 1-79]|uniref:helix-turn-helix domain-containing protein n=1 Tax=Streptomyces sp. Je 1-79 TaxID=2943847 RepID=UPI0021A84DAF|nr:helix-turn-helix transcriptional regulator [Streptomyces sp. Je 1-79]MCT4354681.1 helix-turn-helix transcriptional regulator [Streptomyces sp. Je 1-79]
MPITVDIDVMMARRKMSVGELAERVGITPANLAVLKNGRAKAVRFTTLAALCEVLDCQPGDLLRWEPGPEDDSAAGSGRGSEGGSVDGSERGSEAGAAAETAPAG